MFANELLKEKFTLQQQVEQSQNVDFIDDIDTKDNHQDFTFDQYISKKYQQSEEVQLIKCQREKVSQQDQRSQNEQKQVESQQLTILKQHIMTIESIAMKEIQQLKAQLLRSQQEKKALQQQVKQMKSRNIVNDQPIEKSANVQQGQQLKLLREQNKTLKQALKQQIQINKKLMKQSILNLSIQSKENKCDSLTMDQENDKENNSFISNIKIQKSISNMFEKPSIPLPHQTKRNNLRL